MTKGKRMAREHVVNELLFKDNWEVVDVVDNFLHAYDKMPPKMQLCVDLRMTGTPINEIAKMMKVNPETIRTQLNRAKKRILGRESPEF